MDALLIYFVKVNMALVLFYAFYRLFFHKDTFFRWRRITLLAFFAASLVYPLLNIQEWMREQEPMVIVADLYAANILPEITVSAATPEVVNWRNFIIDSSQMLYVGIALLLMLRFCIQLFSIFKIRFRAKEMILQGVKVYKLSHAQGPFSFFRWIFVHPESHEEHALEEILAHESTHVREWHSVDVVVSELFCALCWFNPFIWLIKREVRNNLEFLADNKVLEQGYDCKTYQYHLLGLTHQKSVATIYNNFNVLPLKNRIKMMNKKRTKQIARTKYLLFVPLLVLLLLISNIDSVARNTSNLLKNVLPESSEITQDAVETAQLPQDQEPQKKTNDEEEAFEIAEVTPEYPGGLPALMSFLSQNVQYPAKAAEKKIEGTVTVKFIVNKDGSISDAIILRGVEPSLDAEALRVINSMPKWKPGKQRGKEVRVKYTIPIRFRITQPVSQEKKVEVVAASIDKSPADNDAVFEVVENSPQYPGGISALMEFLNQNIKYPQKAAAEKIEGIVTVQFVVTKEGNIKDPIVLRGENADLAEEAIRVVKLMPKWQPGTQRGVAVNVKYTVPVRFRLN
ncbi:M56 family peptidase [Bacteroides sp. 214]|uniref:M56 family metallopeptidase n=1 Tax=Bacteroides sp. 214 TaxID=2302935 RepID=UPI0013D8D1AF|nr:M56 family metallopeptidase [Bacteroides sp. 214]NDW13176.1 M56 family peptidase [Bacteroides sp. 214]